MPVADPPSFPAWPRPRPPQAPLSQTLQRVHVAFECLLDIISLQQQLTRAQPELRRRRLGAGQPAGEGAAVSAGGETGQEEEEEDEVLLRIARDLLALGEPGLWMPSTAIVCCVCMPAAGMPLLVILPTACGY